MSDQSEHGGSLDAAQDALNRMSRAHKRQTGCTLTAEMIEALGRTFMGELWGDTDPRTTETRNV